MRKLIAFGIAAGLATAWAFSGYIYRYRLTLFVESDGLIHAGSSVIQIEVHRGININGGGTITTSKIMGESIAVDLGTRGVLFALLSGNSGENADTIAYRIFQLSGDTAGDAALDRYSNVKAFAEVPNNYLPMLVHFKNIKDSKTIEQVDVNNVAQTFGGRSQLVRSTIEMVSPGIWPFNKIGITGITVTMGIEKLFPPWFAEIRQKGALLDGDNGLVRHTDAPLSNKLSISDFSRRY